jgi:ribonuclease H / adenosylcobalamin/alpha-ribazole phosphatase
MNDYLAWFDGSCGPTNPGGTAGSGAIVKDIDGSVLLKETRLVGEGAAMSNNVAEYAALIRVFEFLSSCSPGHAIVHGDSRLVINQLNDKWAVHKGLYYSTYFEARELLNRLHSLGWQIDLQWIPRVQNEECDSLSRGVPTKTGVLQDFHPLGIPSEPCLGPISNVRAPLLSVGAY